MQQTGSKLRKEYVKAVCCHPAYLTNYAEYITWNAKPDEAQVRINIARRIIRYVDDITLMEENEEELKNLLMRVKEKTAGVKFTLKKKNEYHGIQSHHLMKINEEKWK